MKTINEAIIDNEKAAELNKIEYAKRHQSFNFHRGEEFKQTAEWLKTLKNIIDIVDNYNNCDEEDTESYFFQKIINEIEALEGN